jgi:methylenetetrahydrofolate dehydrogenase (NADP+)/methenyltetrahydrofolate cyclohydrolase
LKKKYAETLGMDCLIFGQTTSTTAELKADATKAEILTLIKKLNSDPKCVGIICQLPLPDYLQTARDEICAAVHPLKDIDGLGGIINGRNQT